VSHGRAQTKVTKLGPWWRLEDTVGPAPAGLHVPSTQESTSGVAFWALLTFTFILMTAPQTYFPILISLRVGLITAAVAIVAHLADRFSRGLPPVQLTAEVRPVLWLLVWSILSIPFSFWPGGSLGFLFDPYMKALAVFWLLAACIDNPRRLTTTVWAISLMSLYIGIVAIQQYRAGEFLATSGVTRIEGYNAPLTMNPNDTALTLNLIFPLTIGLLVAETRPLHRLVLSVAVVIDIAGVIATFSRGGFLALTTIYLFYQWKSVRRSRYGWIIIAVVLVLIALPFLPTGYLERIGTIGDFNADVTGSAETRWSDMFSASTFVARSPLVGAGIGMDALALNQERGELWINVHNAYLQLAVDLGIPGLVWFLLLFVRCVRAAREAQVRSTTNALTSVKGISEGLEVSLLGFAVSAFFHPVAFNFYFYYFAGLAIAARNVARGTRVPSSKAYGPEAGTCKRI
jgi:O-antigen ligase